MLLSVIIINYNTFNLTCDCIRSIQQTVSLPHEIILVDNNSKECAPQKFQEAFPEVKLIPLKENVGFGRANNRGVAEACGKYVLLLNSDTLVRERTIDETTAYLEKHSDIDILGCKVITNGGAVQRTVYEYKGELSLLHSVFFFMKRNTILKELIRIGLKQSQKHGKKDTFCYKYSDSTR